MMKSNIRWPRILIAAGFILMLIGIFDPLEGSIAVLAGSLAAAAGAFLGRVRRRKLLMAAFVLIAAGVGIMFAMSAVGGIGGDTGRPVWWALAILPYPAGWIMGLTGAVLGLKEFPKHRG